MRWIVPAFALWTACEPAPAVLGDPCGDGVLSEAEACDDGVNDGAYGGCAPGCRERAPYCGDGLVQEEEACDDGINDGAWGSCAYDCSAPAGSCGDGVVNGPEICDDGDNTGGYGGCRPGCSARAPFCGDAVVNGPEVCDDGYNDGRCGSCVEDCSGPVLASYVTQITVRAVENSYGFPADFTPDLYLEVYDAEGRLLLRTSALTDRDPPVTFSLDGLRADEGTLVVQVWDEDGGAFGDADFLGEILVDASRGGGNANDGDTRIGWEVEDLVCD